MQYLWALRSLNGLTMKGENMINHKNYNPTIDFWRIVATVMIMLNHLYELNIPQPYPFLKGDCFVVFFFLLTGALTARHFEHSDESDKVATSIKYTVRKFAKFLPYTTGAIVAAYVITYWEYLKTAPMVFVKRFLEMPLELFYVSDLFWFPVLGPLWFVSAMAIAFPLLCIVLQWKNKSLVYLLGGYSAIIYFGFLNQHLNEIHLAPIRAFLCMMAGAAAYGISCKVSQYGAAKKRNTIIFLFANVLMVLACGLTAKNQETVLYDICFFVAIACLMSDTTIQNTGVVGRIIKLISNLSFPLYVWHWVVAKILMIWETKFGMTERIILYFAGSVVGAIINIGLIKIFKKKKCENG